MLASLTSSDRLFSRAIASLFIVADTASFVESDISVKSFVKDFNCET
jgi:hypothetical protein